MILIQLKDEDDGAVDDDEDYLGAIVSKDVSREEVCGAATLLWQSQRDQRRQPHKATDLLSVCV